MSFFSKLLKNPMVFADPTGGLALTQLASGSGTAKDGTQALQDYATTQERTSELSDAEKAYGNIPTMLRDKYTKAAQTAGTYANTNEFNSGLNSEVQAGARGARAASADRINALRRALGNNEEFKPNDADPTQTQGNATQEQLAANPPGASGDSATPSGDVAGGASTLAVNPVSDVQAGRRLTRAGDTNASPSSSQPMTPAGRPGRPGMGMNARSQPPARAGLPGMMSKSAKSTDRSAALGRSTRR